MSDKNIADDLREDEHQGEERKSKSRVKREMLKLQEYGARLVDLSSEQLAKIEMPDKLRQAVLDAKGMKKHGARSRQIHYIGAIMRQVDAEPIMSALDNSDELKRAEAIAFKRVELWRDRLIENDNSAFDEVAAAHPHLDRQRLNQLVRNARQEKAKNKPPRSARVLFRYLMELGAPKSDGLLE
ncbi:MAG: DUF615 domain-containing protein [Deltaproteobacteria bacterium]|nr:DUF615 domain-containing protein [Deltaproteobacteria bacterium]